MQATKIDDWDWLIEADAGGMYILYMIELKPEHYQITIMYPIKFSKESEICSIAREVYSTHIWAASGIDRTLEQILERACSCITLEHPIELVYEFGGCIEPVPRFFHERALL